MIFAEVLGPDVVKVTFSTKVGQIDTFGTTITGRTIGILAIEDNSIYYSVDPIIAIGDNSLTWEYTGIGTLTTFPSYAPVDAMSLSITNTIERDYITTLDGLITTGLDNNYTLYNDRIYPDDWLIDLDVDFVTSLDGVNILTEIPSSFLYGDGEEVAYGDGEIVAI